MQLHNDEQILRVYRHHILPMIIKLVATALSSIPFYLIIYWMRTNLSLTAISILIAFITAIFGLMVLHVFIDNRFDKLIVTNKRVIYIDWKAIMFKTENEININNIQEITFVSKGVLSNLKIFNYGKCVIETASHDLSISFPDAPNPSEIRDFILTQKKV